MIIISLFLIDDSKAFLPIRIKSSNKKSPFLSMHFEESVIGNTLLSSDALQSERYIASNRFKVRNNAGPKFEKRWADRKSRLSQLNGFRFFTLLKRVSHFDADYSEQGEFGNYISFTIWENKDCFDAWRTGDAFKEAHGGGGLTDFIQLLSTAIFILDGGPKPAFYDTLRVQQQQQQGELLLQYQSENGWRQVIADGENYLNPEIYVVQKRYKVKEGKQIEFENRIQNNNLKDQSGLVGSFVLRRDATKADDGYNYMNTLLWKSKSDYENYLSSTPISQDDYNNLLQSSPNNAYYEGKLTLASPKGI